MGVVEGIVAGIARAETRLGVVVFAAVGALLALDRASTCRESRDQQQRRVRLQSPFLSSLPEAHRHFFNESNG